LAECVDSGAHVTDRTESVFRFIHVSNTNEDGTLNSGSFSLRRDKEISLGLASRIGARFQAFCDLKPEQGIAGLPVGSILDLPLGIHSDPEPEWREFADAHHVLCGYKTLPNRRKEDLGRRLRDIANANILRQPSRQ
jgi:hypothetical protein